MTIPTVKLYKGDKRLNCNASDEARFVADGWVRKPAAKTPEVEPSEIVSRPKKTK